MRKKYGQWKGAGGLTPRDRMPRSPRKPNYNQPLAVNEANSRRREGTKRWSFVIKRRKPPQRDLAAPRGQDQAAKRQSVRARFERALLLEPILFRGRPPLDLLLRFQLPQLADLLAPIDLNFDPGSSLPDFDPLDPLDPFVPDPGNDIVDPGSSLPEFPTFTFPSDNPFEQAFVFVIPRIIFNPPELSSPFLPTLTPFVQPVRPVIPAFQPLVLPTLEFTPLELPETSFEPGTFTFNEPIQIPSDPSLEVRFYPLEGWTRVTDVELLLNGVRVFYYEIRSEPLRDEVIAFDSQAAFLRG